MPLAKDKSVTVIIPALNEAGNILRLVTEVLSLHIPGAKLSVIVVDNGSTDATAKEALAAGAKVLQENRIGYGYACAAGAAGAQESEILVFMDGDYSSLPSEMPAILTPLIEEKADLVIGSRESGGIAPGAMPYHQRIGNRLACWLMNYLYDLSLTDLGPYRAIHRDLLIKMKMSEMTYGWPTEMTVKAARGGLRIIEVPVKWHRRQAGRSKVSGTLRGAILAAWFILGVTIRYAIQR